jgi:hypothetical protein
MRKKFLKNKNLFLSVAVWCSLIVSKFTPVKAARTPATLDTNWTNEMDFLGNTSLPTASAMDIITGILNWLLIAMGIVSLIGFIVSGLLYFSSAGNDKRMEKAKSAMVACIIGVIVGLSGFVAIRLAANILNRDEF